MDRNLSGLLIGSVGVAMTFMSYNQEIVSSTQCIAAGFLVIMFGLFVKEGFVSL